MSQKQIDRLREFLIGEGYTEGDFSESTPGFRVEAGKNHNTLCFTVEVPLDHPELPEELAPFELPDDELERAIWKGVSEKKTWSGARFEMALRSYVGHLMEKDPECIELSARVMADDKSLTYEEWQTRRTAIWERICEAPQIAAWDAELEKMH